MPRLWFNQLNDWKIHVTNFQYSDKILEVHTILVLNAGYYEGARAISASVRSKSPFCRKVTVFKILSLDLLRWLD